MEQFFGIENELTSFLDGSMSQVNFRQFMDMLKSSGDVEAGSTAVRTRTGHELYVDGQRVVVWGSGSKCVSFMSTLGVRDEIGHVVDINPFRHGKYIPGAGKEVMSPTILRNYNPDVVIVMNRIYQDEICKMLDDMGLNPEVTSV